MNVAQKIQALRERFGMTEMELAELGDIPHSSQISKIETGRNNLSTISMRGRIAQGFGLTLGEINDYLDNRFNEDRAFTIGFPRIAARLHSLRQRNAMSRQDELDQAIQKLGGPNKVGPVIHVVRHLAGSGLSQDVDGWIYTIRQFQTSMARILADKKAESASG